MTRHQSILSTSCFSQSDGLYVVCNFVLTGWAQVNIIPVIGKSDACTKEELRSFKQKVIIVRGATEEARTQSLTVIMSSSYLWSGDSSYHYYNCRF